MLTKPIWNATFVAGILQATKKTTKNRKWQNKHKLETDFNIKLNKLCFVALFFRQRDNDRLLFFFLFCSHYGIPFCHESRQKKNIIKWIIDGQSTVFNYWTKIFFWAFSPCVSVLLLSAFSSLIQVKCVLIFDACQLLLGIYFIAMKPLLFRLWIIRKEHFNSLNLLLPDQK